MEPLGYTRAAIRSNYALISPDTHVRTNLAGWGNTEGVVHISPQIGAGFTQTTAFMAAGGSSALPPEDVERFLYVRTGSVSLNAGGKDHQLRVGGYAFLPADCRHEVIAAVDAELVLFEKDFQPLSDGREPDLVIGHEDDVEGEAFQGDEDARLKKLLPDDSPFDMSVNIFTYQPGATLPQVEIHVMEHGLLMLAGAGVYRLDDDWHPVQEGDVIWMGPYCPQWFVASGKTPARYLYYKDVNRDPLDI
ncbi:MAG: (S)-ureidoglycine aminohydrolase [Pirellulales bacterium]|nr:(S)-ureidoglycine aminohydrolase [Pirellulales bacterium]